jgi:hypothetical protein
MALKILTKKYFEALAADTTFFNDARLGTSDQTLLVPDLAVPSQIDKPSAAARLAGASAAGNNDLLYSGGKGEGGNHLQRRLVRLNMIFLIPDGMNIQSAALLVFGRERSLSKRRST